MRSKALACSFTFHPRAGVPTTAPAACHQALVSELKEELMRLVGSTKKTQKIDHAPGMEVGGHVTELDPGWAAECGKAAAKPSEFFARVPVECPPLLQSPL